MALRWNLAAGFAGSAWAALIAVAFIPVYIRYLGAAGWGAVGFFVTLQGWLSIVDAGFSPAFNREFARLRAGLSGEAQTANLLRSAELLYLAVGAATVAVLASSSHFLATQWLDAQALDAGGVSAALRWLGFAIALQWLASLYRQSLLGLERQVVPHLTAAAAATARAVATWLALASIAPTLPVFVCVQVAFAGLEALVLRSYLRARVRGIAGGRWTHGALAQVRGFAAGLASITLFAIVLTQGDKLLLSALLPLEQFGFVMLAVTVASCFGLAATPIFQLTYPRLSALAGAADNAGFTGEYERWSQWLCVLVLPPAALVAFFSQDVLWLWTRDRGLTASVAPLLTLWTIGSALNALMHVPYAAQLAHGWTRLTLWLNGVAVMLLAPLTLWLVPRQGPAAAGCIWIGINVFYVVVGVQLMHRHILRGRMRAWYARAFLMPASAALAVTGAAWVVRQSHPGLPDGAIVALLASALCAAFAAAVAMTPRPRGVIARWLRRSS